MTMEKVDDTQAQEEIEPAYAFSPEAIEEMGLSVPLVVGDRLCDAAHMRLKEPEAWRTMTYKELRKLFRDNCNDQEGYLSPQAPLLETVVRILLSSKSDSLTIGEIHAEIADLWMTSPWPRHISIESMQRVLDNGYSHGIIRAA